eukprot:643222-Pleurochrysis_carterae.AAC.1
MHTDNARDLTSKQIRDFLLQQGIGFTTSSPRVPRQNGACERQWRTMARDVRATRRILVVPPEIIHRRFLPPAPAQ